MPTNRGLEFESDSDFKRYMVEVQFSLTYVLYLRPFDGASVQGPFQAPLGLILMARQQRIVGPRAVLIAFIIIEGRLTVLFDIPALETKRLICEIALESVDGVPDLLPFHENGDVLDDVEYPEAPKSWPKPFFDTSNICPLSAKALYKSTINMSSFLLSFARRAHISASGVPKPSADIG